MAFPNRYVAGQRLASKLQDYRNRPDVIVLALPRGGVPVGYEVAKELNAPLDVFIVRKLGVPGHEELAMGAIASGGVRLLNQRVFEMFRIPEDLIEIITRTEQRELERQEREYREGRPPLDVQGRTVILVDDGLATGASMHVAVAALKEKQPAHVVVAVPVAAQETCSEFQGEVDRVVCAVTPEPFWSVGQWYDDFSQVSDEEVRDLLRRAANLPAPKAA
jgi:putative phosphoribosyl transferase